MKLITFERIYIVSLWQKHACKTRTAEQEHSCNRAERDQNFGFLVAKIPYSEKF